MDIRNALIILHIIGTALGVGGATVSDYLFFKFSKDGKLDKDEYRILLTVSDIVWAGVFILVLSGFGFMLLYLSGNPSVHAAYNLNKIWAKVTIVIILVANGSFMHRKVLPMLQHRESRSLITRQFIKKSPIMFTAGAISAVSWYSALIIGGWRNMTASYIQIVAIYAVIVLIAIAVSNITGRRLLTHLMTIKKRKKK
ncbi:MAG: hypothetical protein A3E36_00845 [Candidatus Andersenbacteria bacterium RIFCSPHIGHO2_12_FULL_45_11b]|uniref:DUF2214 domain-containing protein n=1 Tax=Candidatus Andersenbacteria bacterium RIFCSPHIGHO2_12_FULL_45_11b TaxID=1797282 RepID=A0A1G1X7Y9_9BACT|nr:MAG: hypothetical protein A3E36_00845 [Candidatus Andersenbacteria bacterium RIFCSPHIGHO2_12_FULL_45_11b]